MSEKTPEYIETGSINWWNAMPDPWLRKFIRDIGKAIVLAFWALRDDSPYHGDR